MHNIHFIHNKPHNFYRLKTLRSNNFHLVKIIVIATSFSFFFKLGTLLDIVCLCFVATYSIPVDYTNCGFLPKQLCLYWTCPDFLLSLGPEQTVEHSFIALHRVRYYITLTDDLHTGGCAQTMKHCVRAEHWQNLLPWVWLVVGRPGSSLLRVPIHDCICFFKINYI